MLRIVEQTLSLVTFQNFLKNKGCRPSRPGAFKGLKLKIALVISLIV